jgi:hypothetical protein
VRDVLALAVAVEPQDKVVGFRRRGAEVLDDAELAG